jgi:DNA-binding beta-propeller fold protein YncE
MDTNRPSRLVPVIAAILVVAGAVFLGVRATEPDAVLADPLNAGGSSYLPLIVDNYPPLPTATPTPRPTTTPTASPLAMITSIPLGDPEGVTADRTTGRVYVADDDTNSIVVLDDATQAVVQTFPVDDDINTVAYDPATNRLFTGYSTPIRILDAATGAQLDTINESVYGDHEIAINPVNRKIYLGDWAALVGSADKVLIYHADTLAKLGEVSLGVDPSFQRVGVAVNPNTGMAYAAYTATNEVTFIDGGTNQVVRVVALDEDVWIPPAVAVDPIADRIYVQCAHETVVLDGTSGDRLATISGYWNTRATPGGGRIYQAVNNRFRVLDGQSYTTLAQLTLPGYMGYGGMDLIPSSRRVYLALSYADRVAVIQD